MDPDINTRTDGPPDQPRGVRLVLASASPRRRELLESINVDFEVRPADIDESRHPDEPVTAYVQRMAREKAQTVTKEYHSTVHAVLAADTVVCVENLVFGKPADHADAQAMWRQLSGRTHDVYTSLALCYRDRLHDALSHSRVTLRVVSDAEMDAYWVTGEPQDKAGGYAIQGLGSAWVERMEGSYSGIVGLPLYELNSLLGTIGEDWL